MPHIDDAVGTGAEGTLRVAVPNPHAVLWWYFYLPPTNPPTDTGSAVFAINDSTNGADYGSGHSGADGVASTPSETRPAVAIGELVNADDGPTPIVTQGGGDSAVGAIDDCYLPEEAVTSVSAVLDPGDPSAHWPAGTKLSVWSLDN